SSSSSAPRGRQAASRPAEPAAQPACVQPCSNANGWIVQTANLQYGAGSGSDFEKPEAGNVYVAMDVTFVNRSGQEQHANPVEFVMKDANGIKHTATFTN